ncbi:molecular chaperone DnaJ [Lachnospiraceae bacterium KK002]
MYQPDEAVSELIHEQATEEQQERMLQNQQRKLEQDRREFEREKKEFYFRKKMDEKRLAEESRLFQMKWKILENELKKVAKEKQEIAREKEQYGGNFGGFHSQAVFDSSEAEMFFSGVNNELALKKRYKELIKIYHPDNLAGDTGTLQMINKTYDILKKQFSA